MRLTFLAVATLLAGPAVAADCGNATSQLVLNQCADAELRAAEAELDATTETFRGHVGGFPLVTAKAKVIDATQVDQLLETEIVTQGKTGGMPSG